MRGFGAALRCEALKARRSKVPPLTALGFSLAPVMAGLFMVILRDPDQARRWGLVSTKARIVAGVADWPAFLGIIGQSVAVGGLLLFALVTAWIFGREFADGTAKNLMALPTSRSATVLAKTAVSGVVSLLLAAWVVALGMGIGLALGLPGGGARVIGAGLLRVGVAGLLTSALVTPVALVASIGRGYMAPLGFALLTLFLAQIAGALGWGELFPWSVPALLTGAAGPEAAVLGPASYLVVGLTSLLGLAATVAWWRWADQAA